MTTFTIDIDNNITAHRSADEAAAVGDAERFSTAQELAELAANWPADRLIEIWNSLTGVTPIEKFKDAKTAVGRIWKRIEGLGAPEKPREERKAKGGVRGAKGAPSKAKSSKKTTAAKKAPKAKRDANTQEGAGPREGSKTAQVVAMLQRKNGATLPEIMEKLGWQKHTVRGFVAGAMKNAGYTIESFKSDKGERTYRINQ